MSENINKFTELDLRKGHHFKLNIGHHKEEQEKPGNEKSEKPVEKIPHNSAPANHPGSHHKERTFKTVFKDGLRQIIASFIILVSGFLILNWSAISQNVAYKWREFRGTQEVSPLEDLTEKKNISYTQENLKTSTNTKIQKKQIPALNLEIAPIDSRIIIPRINKNIPIIKVSSESLIKRDWEALEDDMQEALKNGVVHYPGTSLPGQTGNVVITGHSSYFPWDPGRFKDVFALLHEVEVGDKIVIYYEQDKYTYEVDEKKVIQPDDVEVLLQTPDDRLTLITCTPVGTNLRRLIVTAKVVAKNNTPIVE